MIEADEAWIKDVKFDTDGLVCVVVQDVQDGEVLMVAWANAEALRATQRTGLSHFYSRSRDSLWQKGESSGSLQRVQEIRIDCDQDTILYRVKSEGAACHTGDTSCFIAGGTVWRAG